MVRLKNRWFLVELLPYEEHGQPVSSCTSNDIRDTVKESIIKNFGDEGWGTVGESFHVKYYSPVTGLCIIRVARDGYRTVWGAITLTSSIKSQAYIPNVLHVSGTLKKIQLEAIKYNHILIARVKSQLNKDQYLEKSDKDINAIDT